MGLRKSSSTRGSSSCSKEESFEKSPTRMLAVAFSLIDCFSLICSCLSSPARFCKFCICSFFLCRVFRAWIRLRSRLLCSRSPGAFFLPDNVVVELDSYCCDSKSVSSVDDECEFPSILTPVSGRAADFWRRENPCLDFFDIVMFLFRMESEFEGEQDDTAVLLLLHSDRFDKALCSVVFGMRAWFTLCCQCFLMSMASEIALM
mmetsp:Transcript_20462/g.50146  ORF Transcript_20462/g.50146 Transcript_20462/m.50146 type:complete len:204 (-) Transcript_20462:87-698(-)